LTGCGIPIQSIMSGRSLRPLLAQTGELKRPPAVLVETYGSYGNMDFDLTAKSAVTCDVAYTRFGDGKGIAVRPRSRSR